METDSSVRLSCERRGYGLDQWGRKNRKEGQMQELTRAGVERKDSVETGEFF